MDNVFTKKQKEKIERNLKSFINNFGEPKIVKEDYGPGFYVYRPGDDSSWIQYCVNIDYLDGWLYGCVQGANNCIKKIEHEKLQMTRNEYLDYCKNAVANGNTKALHAEVDILPLNLEMYTQLKKETKTWINALFDYETNDSKGNYMLTGDCRRVDGYFRECENLSCKCVAVDGYSAYGYNDEEMLLYTYCEHDTSLKIFTDKEIYEKEKAELIRWYKEEY